MISLYETLNETLKTAVEICGDDSSPLFTKLPLRLWASKGVISCIEIKNAKISNSDIILIETLIAIRLTKVYGLEEIAQARQYLELNCSIDDEVSTQSLIKYIRFKKKSIEKKSVIKNVIANINDIKDKRNLTEQLHLANIKEEIISDYFYEFLKVKKEVEKYFSRIN